MFETIIPLRWTTKLLAGLLAITLCSTSLNAQNTPQPGGKLARPVSQPLVRQQVSPELQAVLETWYKNSSQIKRLEGQHVNEDINDTFLVIKKSTGKFWFEAPDKGRIDLEPAKIAKEQEKRGKKLYKIQPGSRKRWVCDGKQIMRITTDSRPMEDPKEPDEDHLFQLFRLFGTAEQTEEMAAMYRRGGFGYGEVKKAVAEASEGYFSQARARREELESNLDYVHQVLQQGAERARQVAGEVLGRAQRACGLR